MDAGWEIAGVVGIVAGLALVHAYRAGSVIKSAETIVTPPPLPPDTQINDALNYDPYADVTNGFVPGNYALPDFTPLLRDFPKYTLPNFTFPIFVTENTPSLSVTAPATGEAVNLSNGTPQCGCSNSEINTFADLMRAQTDAINRTIDAMNGLHLIPPTVPVRVTLTTIIQNVQRAAVALIPHVRYYGNQGGSSALVDYIDPTTGHVVYTR